MSPEQLCDIEAIRQLKARYLRYADTRQWEDYARCFTEDVSALYVGVPRAGPDAPSDWAFEGVESLINLQSVAVADMVTIHQAHLPEITLIDATTANGVWAVHDYLVMPHCTFRGWGHYHEEYRKVDGGWKISKLRLSRIRVEEIWRDASDIC